MPYSCSDCGRWGVLCRVLVRGSCPGSLPALPAQVCQGASCPPHAVRCWVCGSHVSSLSGSVHAAVVDWLSLQH